MRHVLGFRTHLHSLHTDAQHIAIAQWGGICHRRHQEALSLSDQGLASRPKVNDTPNCLLQWNEVQQLLFRSHPWA